MRGIMTALFIFLVKSETDRKMNRRGGQKRTFIYSRLLAAVRSMHLFSLVWHKAMLFRYLVRIDLKHMPMGLRNKLFSSHNNRRYLRGLVSSGIIIATKEKNQDKISSSENLRYEKNFIIFPQAGKGYQCTQCGLKLFHKETGLRNELRIQQEASLFFD